jgi:endogenous inhibitor of DNA gyrase (YacG/DUF329 family)
MPSCIVCNKDHISEDLTTIGNQSVCCLSCVGLLKANINDACSYCGRPVWKDNYYEIDQKFYCSEKCKNIIQKRLIKKKGFKYIKCRHFKEEKYYNDIESPNKKLENKENRDNSDTDIIDFLENDEWNKKSFIQKETNFDDENNNIKENIKINNNHQRKNLKKDKKDKKDNNNIIKSMKKYFKDTKDSIYKMRYKKKAKYNRITENRMICNEYNKLPKPSLLKVSNVSLNPLNNYNWSTNYKNPFSSHNVTDFNKRNLSIGKSENNRNTIEDNYYVFNPIRRYRNSKSNKKISYPTDSLTFPTDTLPSEIELNRDSSINCCNFCRKPIIIRNSNVHKDFCSNHCKNEYYKKMK